MVTRAEIVEMADSKGAEWSVNIRAYDGIEDVPNVEEPSPYQSARVCTIPGFVPEFNSDIPVFVCIEDNNLSQPIIMGNLILNNYDNENVGVGTAKAYLSKLTVTGATTLSSETSIGDVTSNQLGCLVGVNSNIQNQFNTNIAQKIALLGALKDKLNNFSTYINAI